jgi:transglutaminase-like putative cysteine protease
MTIQRWLQIHLVALCLLGSLFVALSTRSLIAPGGVLIAGILSIWFTDTWKWLRLNRLLGNLAAIGAVLLSLNDFLGNPRSEDQLLAIATLLVYLQVILFFQEKNPRLYWQMILLSLLQVVVGAALHLGFVFGVLLLLYTVVALSTLVLFFIHRETERQGESLNASTPAAAARGWARLLGQPVAVRVDNPVEQLRRAFLSLALIREIALLTLGAVVFSAAFFYTVPRHPAATWSGPRGFTRSETGFSRSVELQQMGELLQSDQEVMKAYLRDSGGKSLHRFDPYFAGEVLPVYETDERGRARWMSIGMSSGLVQPNAGLEQRSEVEPLSCPDDAVTVRTAMRYASESLFTITPAYKTQRDTDQAVRMDPSTGLLFQDLKPDGNNPTNLILATTGVRDGRQLPIAPEIRPNYYPGRKRYEEEQRVCEQWGQREEALFPRLKQIASDIIAKRGLDSQDPIAVGRGLEEYFHTSGFTYSLNLNVKRDPASDPIEDFVANHRTGHCQYFASALVMMLRSQGIPARMVVGYRGSEFNDVGQFYVVRQRNAHAWVEVYLRPHQIPDHEVVGGVVGRGGGWLRLDPTPSSDAASDSADWVGTARDWLDYMDTIWGDYVVSLTQKRQEQALYLPFRSGDTPTAGFSWQAWRESLRTVAAWFGIHIGDKEAGGRIAFDWRAAVTAMVLSALSVLLTRLLRWAWPRIDWSEFAFWRSRRGRRSPVAFYNRLEELLATRGRSRRPAETPQEYVEHAVRDLSLPQGDALRRLIAAFYRVRFGGDALDNTEAQAIEQALADLHRTPLREAP